MCLMFNVGTDNKMANEKDSFYIFLFLSPFIPFFFL